MRTFFCAAWVLCLSTAAMAADAPKPFVTGLKSPESVCYGPGGLLYVTEIGEFGKDGDGQVAVVEDGKTRTFATGLDDPKGMVYYKDALYVTDKTQVIKVDDKGKTSVYAAASKFPIAPKFLNDIAVDVTNGVFLVSDSGDLMGKEGAVFRIDVKTNAIDLVASPKTIPDLKTPNGVIFDGDYHYLLADFGSGDLYRVKFADLSAQKIASGMEGADALIWDNFGRPVHYVVEDRKSFRHCSPWGKAGSVELSVPTSGRWLLGCQWQGTDYSRHEGRDADQDFHDHPWLGSRRIADRGRPEAAFPNLKWTGWDDGLDSGKPNPLRPSYVDARRRRFEPRLCPSPSKA